MFTGWIVDWTGDYNGAFYFTGTAFIVGGVLVGLVDKVQGRSSSQNPANIQINEIKSDEQLSQIN